MLTRDDLIDLLVRHIDGERSSPSPKPIRNAFSSLPELKGRKFLTEFELKRQLTGPSQQLTIPKDAILSPLALEWLALGRIKVVRE